MFFRHIAFGLALAGGFCLFQSAAQAQCSSFQEPEVTLQPIFDTPRMSRTLNIQGISNVSRSQAFKLSGENEIPVGFTRAAMTLETSFDMKSIPDHTMRAYCTQITGLTIRFGFTGTIIYIAKELGTDTCAADEVLEHEQKHVVASEEVLATYAPIVRKSFRNLAEQIGVLQTATTEEAEHEIQKTFDSYISGYSKSLETVFNNRQKLIDTPDEYHRLSTVCDGEISTIANRRSSGK